MNSVAAGRQLLSQFRAYDPTPAVSWIDCDADVHEVGFGLWSLVVDL